MMRHSDQESRSGWTIRLRGGDCTASRNMQSQIAEHEQWPLATGHRTGEGGLQGKSQGPDRGQETTGIIGTGTTGTEFGPVTVEPVDERDSKRRWGEPPR